jgi:hypothetical protein
VPKLQSSDRRQYFLGKLARNYFLSAFEVLGSDGLPEMEDFISLLEKADFITLLENSNFLGILEKAKYTFEESLIIDTAMYRADSRTVLSNAEALKNVEDFLVIAGEK